MGWVSMLRAIIAGALALCVTSTAGAAQQQPRVVLGFGVDTVTSAWSDAQWHRHVPEIVRAWRAYLSSTPGTPGADMLWSAPERKAWPAYDLTGIASHQGFPATILDVRPVGGHDDVFEVKTLFASAIGPDREVKAVALTRVFAVRENGHWVFANALPRLTSDWRRTKVGGRADRAAARTTPSANRRALARATAADADAGGDGDGNYP